MDVRSTLAAQSYARAQQNFRGLSQADNDGQTSPVQEFVTSYVDTLRQNEEVAQAGLVGDADPHSVVEALASTELAIETAVTVRNKVVEAYQEILRMPV